MSLPDVNLFLSGKIKTLGFGVLDWCSENLVQPDGDGKGDPWVFKPDQAHFVLAFYAVDDTGRWVYRRAYRERAKGTGKSPMVAAVACAEFLGPVKFSHFDPDSGQPIGVRNHDSHVQLAAVSEKQCKSTFAFIMEMLSGCAGKYGIEIGMTKIQILGGGTDRVIEMITANHRSQEGFRPTFAIFEETQHWLPSERGPDFAQTVRRNLKKKNGRDIEVTNAPIPGEGSVAELTHQFYQEIQSGSSHRADLLFDTFSIHVDDIYDKDQAMPALQEMYKDAPWIDLETTFGEICDPSTREVDARRFYFNEIVPPNSMWIPGPTWDAAERQLTLKRTDLISLGFKARKHCGAISATRLKDSAVFLLDLWERPQNAHRDWEVPYAEIDGRMRQIFEKYNVYNVVASPESFQDIVGRWAIDYEGSIEIEELWTSRNRQRNADCIEMFETAVKDQRLIHDGNVDLSRHVMNCFVDVVAQGNLLKQEGQRHIAAAEAAILSFKAAQEAIEDGALKERPDATLYIF